MEREEWMRTLFLVSAMFLMVTGCNEVSVDDEVASEQWEVKGRFCGGIAGIPCPAGQRCMDDPTDDCDPKNGGADCGGICVGKPNCHKGDRNYSYVGTSPEECTRILFMCEPGMGYFSDDCGCGCYRSCDDPLRHYVSRSVDECATIRFYCAEGTPFSDSCGCGCYY